MDKSEPASKSLSWENLAIRPLTLICRQLSLLELIRMRLVCQAWKRRITRCYRPYLVSNDIGNVISPVVYSIHGFAAICLDRSWLGTSFIGSSHGWLIATKTEPLACFLVNIFAKLVINLPEWDASAEHSQVCLSSSPLSRDCTVLLLGTYLPGFLFCKPGDTEWTIAKCKYSHFNENQDFLCQAVLVDKVFCALSHQGRLALIDNVEQTEEITLLSDEMVQPMMSVKAYRQYLIECKGEIMVVFLCRMKDTESEDDVGPIDHVEVFRFDYSTWTRIYNLHDDTFFVGKSCCFSISAPKIGWEDNLVYFTDTGRDIMWGTFDMEGRRFRWIPEDGAWAWPLSKEYNCTWFLPSFEISPGLTS